MKIIQKYLYILLLGVILLTAAVFCASAADSSLPRFLIAAPHSQASEAISIFDAEDGNYYVFLPSYADMAQVRVSLSGRGSFSLDGQALTDGMDCSAFEPDTPYTFSSRGQKTATLWFYRSANVAAIYIHTATGNMEYIHEDKTNEEYASVMLYTADGKVNHADDCATLEGRGNGTWAREKRPYSLALSESGNLLDMGSAVNWVLLANAFDETNLNNKLILDLASRTGFSWVPQCQWVDVYLNGSYNGLYLLTEKVEVHDQRLNIDTGSGDFLCKIELNRRWDLLRNPLLTEAGRAVEICDPAVWSDSAHADAAQLVNQMEQVLLSGTDLQEAEIIDLDSWVRRYLIDEISGNIDSDLGSSYFYFQDGVCYAGPVWDYDLAFGNSNRNQESNSFIAKNEKKSAEFLSPYYSALYRNESFYQRMVEIYRTEFAPVLQEMLGSEIDSLIRFIDTASRSNSIRWRPMFDQLQRSPRDAVHTPEELKTYLIRRFQFLNSAWLENTPYCTLQFENAPGNAFWNVSVPKGTCLETTHVNLETTVWIDTATGEPFDFSQPIVTDMILSRQIEETPASVPENAEPEYNPTAHDYITICSIAILLVMLAGLVTADILQRRRERRASDARKGTEIPS